MACISSKTCFYMVIVWILLKKTKANKWKREKKNISISPTCTNSSEVSLWQKVLLSKIFDMCSKKKKQDIRQRGQDIISAWTQTMFSLQCLSSSPIRFSQATLVPVSPPAVHIAVPLMGYSLRCILLYGRFSCLPSLELSQWASLSIGKWHRSCPTSTLSEFFARLSMTRAS